MPAELPQDASALAPTDAEFDATPAPSADSTPGGEPDREGAMAKADLFKLANYSHKLYKQLDDNDQLESWVQAKITKAADYIASVFHYLEYEMKFSEYGHHLDNSDTLSEGQKMRLKEVLAEAKKKVADLKKTQAEKVEEGIHTHGREMPCAECGGSGVVYQPVPEETKEKVAKYNRLMKATKAAHKRMDANHNGVPDEDEMEEDFDSKSKVGDTYKTKRGGTVTKTSTGIRHEKGDYSDEPHVDAQKAPSKAGMTGAERRAQKAVDKEQDKESKAWEKKYPGTVRRHTVSDKSRDEKADSAFAKDDKKEESIQEGKPSAGLSKAKKSAVVKKAKSGGDIGKPGKNFDKVAKAAGGGKKGEKIAAAAMWKNIKEETAYIEEKKAVEKKAKKDWDKDGKIETGSEEHAGAVDNAIKASKKEKTNESFEIDRLKALTSRLLG